MLCNRVLLPAAAFVLAIGACAQTIRDPRVLTVVQEAHLDAKISPDGSLIAFRGPSKIGVVAWSGGLEATLVTGTNLGDFLWAPASTGIYFVDGTTLKYVARSGGMATTIAPLAGDQHRLSAVTGNDRVLYGSRRQAQTVSYHIFTVLTNGTAAPIDIVTSLDVVDAARLTPDDQRIVFRRYNPAPFTPREYLMANANGTNPVSLTNGPINGNPEDADWIDSSTVLFNLLSPVSSRTHLAAVSTTSSVPAFQTEGLSIRRRSSVSGNRQWLLCEAQVGGGGVPAVMPVRGGGLVPLVGGQTYAMQGPPTIDQNGRRVAWAGTVTGVPGFSQIHAVELDRELEIRPRAEINRSFTVALPVQQNELGAAILSIGLGGPFPLPGIRYELVLDPSVLLIVLTGTGSGSGPLTVSIPVPNDPTIIGATFQFQGLRALGANAEFTRASEVRVF